MNLTYIRLVVLVSATVACLNVEARAADISIVDQWISLVNFDIPSADMKYRVVGTADLPGPETKFFASNGATWVVGTFPPLVDGGWMCTQADVSTATRFAGAF